MIRGLNRAGYPTSESLTFWAVRPEGAPVLKKFFEPGVSGAQKPNTVGIIPSLRCGGIDVIDVHIALEDLVVIVHAVINETVEAVQKEASKKQLQCSRSVQAVQRAEW